MNSITLQTNDSDVISGDVIGQIAFAASNETNTADARLVAAMLKAVAEDTFTDVSNKTAIVFATADSEIASEKMRLDRNGNLGIATSTPSAKLNVENGNVIFNDLGGDYDFRVEGNNDANLFFTDGGSDRIGIGLNNPTSRLHISTSTTNNSNPTPFNLNSRKKTNVDTNGTYYERGFTSELRWKIDSGISDAGNSINFFISSLRNYAEAGDAGSKTTIYNILSQYGHFNTSATSPTTTHFYGFNNTLYANTGSITNAYDLFCGRIGSNVTNHYGLYITHDGKNYLGGNVGIKINAPSTALDIDDNKIRLRTAKTPGSATDIGNTGDICWDANYIYICTATNQWKRAAISTWT